MRFYKGTSTHSKERALEVIKGVIDAGNLVFVESRREEPSLKNEYNKNGDICYDIKGYEPAE